MQTNRLHILLLILSVCLSSLSTKAQVKTIKTNPLAQVKGSIVKNDSIVVKNDSITSLKNDSIAPPKKKEAIENIIEHTAKGYILEDVVHRQLTLYDEAHIIYGENDITAGIITIDQESQIVRAKGIPDKDGKYSQLPVFKTTGNKSTQDSLIFSAKTKKAIIYGLETKQNGMNTLGEKTKRVNDSTIFVRNIVFTTSDPKNPDYYLKTNKAKVVPGKKIITGLTNLVIADIPTPAIFPFAYFPLTQKRTSGIIVPTYGESNNQGFFLQNGGYYFVLNDYFDLKLTGSIYSNSSWGFNATSNYKVRYKFSGNFNFSYNNLITGSEGFSNYSLAKNFNIRWSHSQDSKASPNSRFSASVNLGSSQYFRQSVNQANNGLGLQNSLNSSISYSKNFVGTPFNISLTANHSQNTNTKTISLTLPSLQLNMKRIYPFAPKNGAKKNAFQKIGITYSMQASNQIETKEKDFSISKIFSKAKNGAKHNVSVSTNMKLFKYFSLSPSINYNEVWSLKKIHKRYNATEKKVITDTISGFNAYRTYSGSTSISTTIYGMYKFRNSRLKAIRHTMRPNVSYSYRPDFGFYSKTVQADSTGTKFNTYTPFDNGVYGGPSSGTSNSLTFSIANTLEGKVANKKDPKGEDKKITIFNALNLSSSYNFSAEHFKLSPINMSGGTKIFKKMNINFGATLDPYALDANKQRIDVFNYKQGGSLLRITSARFTTGYSFSSKDLHKKKDGKKDDDDTTAYDQDMTGRNLVNNNFSVDPNDEINNKKKKGKTTDLPQYISAMPWNLRFSLSTNYSNSTGENKITSNSIMFSGNIELSPGWKVGISSGYDFIKNGVTYTNLTFSRDLKSWNMNFNWVPLGNNSSYYFFIGVKASVFSALKWDKRNVNRSF